MSVVEQLLPSNRYLESFEMPDIKQLVSNASDVIAPVWPLKTFIAVNPLQGLENLPFETAVIRSHHYRTANEDGNSGRESVNREMIKWCSVFFDQGQATIPMPHREQGLYHAFVQLASYDSRLLQESGSKVFLEALPSSAEEAILQCLEELKVPTADWEDFIRQSFAALPGWSGYVKWREHWQNPSESRICPSSLIDYVAVRLVLTRLLWPDAAESIDVPVKVPSYLRELPIAEKQFREELLRHILLQVERIKDCEQQRPDAQLVFCIDVRSEPFRKSIEAQGNYKTLGFAGFFGLPIRVSCLGHEHSHDSCPVLLKPAHEVSEIPFDVDSPMVRRNRLGLRVNKLKTSLYQWLKYNFATPFALVEMVGPWLGLRMFAKTYAPSLLKQAIEPIRQNLIPEIDAIPDLASISWEKQADYGESALRMMGLTNDLAPLVVLCGHGSTTNNNAFASALDCGACGGNHGGSNARALAAILNNPRIRLIMAERGLSIPEDTLFLAAEHNTTTDEVSIFGACASSDHQSAINNLRRDLAYARSVNASHRCKTFDLPLHRDPVAATKERSIDWAQPRPEWGLARNAAFIVGPRDLTDQIDLEGRCFLHSYDWSSDDEGRYLTTILTAPMVVAQWINNQYLFSTLDNVAYGAGSKVTKNIVGKMGVMQGNASDLMHGLPLQSVYASDNDRHHEPLRLLTVVYSPRHRVQSIIDAQPVLQKLLFNGWVSMVVIDPIDRNAHLLERDGTWQRVN